MTTAAPNIGDRATFTLNQSTDGPVGIQAHNGQECTVVQVFIEADDDHDPEALPMYAVLFADGYQCETFEDELAVISRESK